MNVRAERTRVSLRAAMLELAAAQPIGEIPVTRIVERAGVNRSSFYQHYGDREELLADALETVASETIALTHPIEAASIETVPAELEHFAQHFAEYADVYRRALGPAGSALIAARVRERIRHLVREGIQLSSTGATESLPVDVRAAGIAGALLGIVEAWIGQEPMATPRAAARWMWLFLVAPESSRG